MARSFGLSRRGIAVGALGALVAGLAIGIPTDVVPNPWFTRMSEVRFLDVLFLAASSLLLGALLATYVRPEGERRAGAVMGSGVLSVLAIGCPICNKLVVTLIGVSGALNVFAPLQPLLGAAGIAVAALALRSRLRGLRDCPLPTAVEASG